MTSRRSSVHEEKGPDLSFADRRLSALSVEERDVEMPSGGDLSEVSTLALGADDDHIYPSQQARSPSTTPDASGWSTPTTYTPSTPIMNTSNLSRQESNVMLCRVETDRKWSRFPRKGYQTTTKYFYEEIDGHWTSALIVVCFFVAGLIDAVAYQTFSVFTSLQTGNTIMMALRLSNQPTNRHSFAYIKSITSVASYCLGGLFFNVLHRAPTDLSNPRPRLHRWTLFLSFLIQSTLLTIAATLAQSGWISTQPFVSGTFSSGSTRNPDASDNYLDLIPVAFLAFEAAGQVCLSRVLVVADLPTIVISTLYHDFVADALSWRQLWRARTSTRGFLEGQKRQIRRLLCILALFAGALVGGFVYASPGGIAAALWIAAATKVVVCVAWCLWKKKVVTETVVTHDSDKKPA